MHNNISKLQNGFTLIELSVVLVIISILVGSGISIGLVQMENSRITATKTKQETIKLALLNYISRNYRLPCPAVATLNDVNANYGLEAATPGTCSGTVGIGGGVTRNVRGIVPWKTLGITDETTLDGYGRRFTYQVLRSQTNLNQNTISGLKGNIEIYSNGGKTPADPEYLNPNYPAVAVLISHGNNGRGAYLPGSGRRLAIPTTNDPDERENTDNNLRFVQKGYANTEANPFDDIVLWLEPTSMVAQLNQQGNVPSSNSVLTDRFSAIQNSLLGYIMADNIDPGVAGRTVYRRLPFADSRANPNGNAVNGALTGFVAWQTIGISGTNATDPWGKYIRYSVNTTLANNGLTLNNPSPSSLAAYTLSSDGPDGIQANADDLTLTIPVGNMRGLLSKVSIDL